MAKVRNAVCPLILTKGRATIVFFRLLVAGVAGVGAGAGAGAGGVGVDLAGAAEDSSAVPTVAWDSSVSDTSDFSLSASQVPNAVNAEIKERLYQHWKRLNRHLRQYGIH